MEIQKSIEIFLEKNNLSRTLQLFKNESKRKPSQYGPAKLSQLAHIHKFTLNVNNETEVREHFQKTDPALLAQVVKKLKRKSKNTVNGTQNNISNNASQEVSSLVNMKFFRKLIEK